MYEIQRKQQGLVDRCISTDHRCCFTVYRDNYSKVSGVYFKCRHDAHDPVYRSGAAEYWFDREELEGWRALSCRA